MSFIFGIINLDGKFVNQGEIGFLFQAVKWEGFKEQIEVAENYAIGYCHHPERQPKAGIFVDDELIVLADIRIYNSEELKKSIVYTSPEEAFAKAYLRWGVHCANHINGDFAVVLFDREKNEVHLFRDHIGVRPLTYWFQGNRLIFASHEFGLAKSGLVTSTLQEEYVVRSLFRLKGYYNQTIFHNIFKAIPGRCSTFSKDKTETIKYWRPEEIRIKKDLTFDESVTKLRQLLASATLNRMENGITGAHVSGGLDSTGVACLLADVIGDKNGLIGYSWSPEQLEEEFDGLNEKELIEAFSSEKGVKVKYLEFSPNEYVQNGLLPEFGNMYNEISTMKLAEKDGTTTLFSGWGGDEFVSLSTRGVYNHLFFRFKWWTLGRIILRHGIKSGIMQLRTEVLPLFVPFGLLHTYQPIDWRNLRFFKLNFILKHWKLIFFHSRKNIFGYGNRSRFMLNLLHNYHLPERMDNWCLFAEKYGLDYKYPLLDKELLEFWFSLPVEHTFKDMSPRLLYREALKGILTEQVRVRIGKDEGQLMTSMQLQQKDGKEYLQDLLVKSRQENQISFFKVEEFQKLLLERPDKKQFSEFRKISKAIFYLRMLGLVKNYLSNDPCLTNTRLKD